MSETGTAFASTYAQARANFIEAAGAAGVAVQSHVHPLKGRDGETLAMDVTFEGAADAPRLLIISSGCHGVEGHCGSGVQVDALHDPAWRQYAQAHGVAVLYIHALNPHGFSHTRRTTPENVDLNRNFQDFSGPLPVNAAYRELHALLLPNEWPPTQANGAALEHYIASHGMPAYQAAVSGGQHEFPDGLFFGGTAPCWSNLTLRQVLRQHARAATQVAWIDVHTGLGPSGVGERIYAGRDDQAAVMRARAWWGSNGKTPVTSIYDGTSTSALLTGLMCNAVYDECAHAQYTGLAMEYGTVPILETLQALRAEHWLHQHPDAPAELARQIKQQMLRAFYTDTETWKTQVLSQARESMRQAVAGLSA